MPCYSYGLVRKLDDLPEHAGYFHASWRQQLINLGREDYVAVDATGKGKFIGWNVTVRLPRRSEYLVDENEKFYADGEERPSMKFQGLENSFGFSWGFPAEESIFLRTGWFPFHKDGATAYRFFLEDATSPLKNRSKWPSGSGETKTPCSDLNSAGQKMNSSFPARFIGTN